MAHKNSIIKSDYTINVAGAIQDEYLEVIYHSDFNNSTVGEVPAGWTTNESDETPTSGPRVNSNSSNTNRAFALIGAQDLHSDVVNPPLEEAEVADEQDFYRWAQLEQTFNENIKVTFRAYQGRGSGEYGAVEAPSSSKEKLHLQYKIGNGAWTTASYIQHESANPWDLDETITVYITDVGQDEANPLSLRWISRAIVDSSTHSIPGNDHWAFDQVVVYANPNDPTLIIPKRLTFFGAPNLRGQTTTEAYKTFLGKVRV